MTAIEIAIAALIAISLTVSGSSIRYAIQAEKSTRRAIAANQRAQEAIERARRGLDDTKGNS